DFSPGAQLRWSESAASTNSATRALGRKYRGGGGGSIWVRPFAQVMHLRGREPPCRNTDELIERARRGEEAAQAAIYGALGPAVFALIRRLVANRAVAEDLFQDTMMVLFQRLRDFRGEAPLGAWLRQIAVTRSLMYLRSPWHRARLRWDTDDDAPPSAAVSPVMLATPGDALDVERAMAMLTPVGRAVVWL